MVKSEVSKIIIILGMHRSGTSLLSAGLNSLGVDFGENLLVENDENPKGFFENLAIVSLNERILEKLGYSWNNPFLFNLELTENIYQLFKQEASIVLQKYFSKTKIWGIKDPRICLLLPFWEKVIEENFRCNIYHVHIVRNPLEVAESLAVRQIKQYGSIEDVDRECNLLLWLSYQHKSLQTKYKNRKKILLSFGKLLEQPENELLKLSSFLDIQAKKAEVERYCQSFIDKGLRHHKRNDEGKTDLFSHWLPIINCYNKNVKYSDLEVLSENHVRALSEQTFRALTHVKGKKAHIASKLFETRNAQKHSSRQDVQVEALDTCRKHLIHLKKLYVIKETELENLNKRWFQLVVRRNEFSRSIDQRIISICKKIIPFYSCLEQRFKDKEQKKKYNKERNVLVNSAEFDQEFYIEKYLDVNNVIMDPILHYLTVGYVEGYRPNKNFDPVFYLKKYPDVDACQINPLVHYILYGKNEKRVTEEEIIAFDEKFYRETYTDIGDIDPLYHYKHYGKKEGRLPSKPRSGPANLYRPLSDKPATFSRPDSHSYTGVENGKKIEKKTLSSF